MVSRRDALRSAAVGTLLLGGGGVQAVPRRGDDQDRDWPGWARGVEGQRKADLGNGTFLNPIVAGDHPDPSILKDGDDYYMTFSTFEAYPGLVIWHSRDLVNWRPLLAALQKNIGSVWAPELCKHNGRYYLYIPTRQTSVAGSKTTSWVIWADDIRGPWSGPIDLDLPLHIDHPRNPLVRTTSVDERWWSRGHATLVQGPAGDWWSVYHGYEHGFWTLGRQTLLAPVTWSADGWPVFGGGDLSQPIRSPRGGTPGPHGMALSDDFSADKYGVHARQFTMHRYGIEHGRIPQAFGRRLRFRIRNHRHVVSIHTSVDGVTWQRGPRGLEVSGYHHNVRGGFMALKPALYAAGKGEVRFRRFRYRGLG